MPVLIQNINGNIVDNLKSNTSIITNVKGEFGYEQWFKIGYLEVFIQNFKNTLETTDLNKISKLGLTRNKDKVFTELEISY